MDSKTIVIFGAGIGGIVAARRSSKEGGAWGCDPSPVPRQTWVVQRHWVCRR